MSACSTACAIASSMASRRSGTISNGTKRPPHCSHFAFTSTLFVSKLRPRAAKEEARSGSNGTPGATNSLPVGMNATRGRRTTGTDPLLPEPIRAAKSGVISWPARPSTSPRRMALPAGRVPAPGFEGAASMITCCSSAETCACSMTMAVSNPSGMATPVLANCQSRPRTHELVSGTSPSARSAKSDQCSAMESMAHVSALGISFAAHTSYASTRPTDSDRETRSTSLRATLPAWSAAAARPRQPKPSGCASSAASVAATASSRDNCICCEWSLMTASFPDTRREAGALRARNPPPGTRPPGRRRGAARALPAYAEGLPSASYSRLNTTQTIVQIHVFACLSFAFAIERP